MPVDVDVDSDATLLLVVLKPVDSELIPVDVDVDNDTTLLLVVLRPVDNELIPVDVDVDKLLIAVFVANNCEPLIASVLVAVTWPAATFVTCRSAPAAPTLTTLVGFVPA
ncbi:hypothetical protein WM31_28940 [Burkholderia ubonensis]|nr:hypothetical protein WM31_28940 [Burkholderia ubonensis]